ncbi:MAG: chromosomal replication initiator protein DnaA [Spirochaetota bacterium]
MGTASRAYSVFWDEALTQLRSETSEQEFSMWFAGMTFVRSEDDTIVVSVPSYFYRDQIKQRYLSLIENKLYELSGRPFSIQFEIRQAPRPEHTAAKEAAKQAPLTSRSSTKKPHPELRPEYSFDNFVIGENNSFAANAAMAIARNPGTGYNPCLVYGGVGLGKTHLVQSIGNSVHQEFNDLKVVYVTAENFTNEFIRSIREKKMHQFKSKYRYADVLLIDDIHFLQKKTETQEELFHTFNALYDANKQMVFTCDRPVSELRELADRLRSRFERGLNVDLQPPSYETRYAILKKKIEAAGIHIPEDAISLICTNVTTNVRDLESALTKLIAYAELVNKNITLEIARQQLKDVFSNPKQSNISIDLIQRQVAEYFNLSTNDLKGKKRTQVITFPRQLAMYITREITEYSTTEVGLEFGGRDHTTVMHACQRIESRMRTDATLEPTIQHIIRNIKEKSAR